MEGFFTEKTCLSVSIKSETKNTLPRPSLAEKYHPTQLNDERK